jgi:DHA3 family multidrug efflux protein-like MFS transporter
MATAGTPRLTLTSGPQRVFAHLLLNTLVVSVMNYTLWFAVTFWIYLETASVFATGMIAGIFLVATAGTGVWFGSLVDHHRKKSVMQASAVASTVAYLAALAVYLLADDSSFANPGSPVLWTFVVLLMSGVISGNLRSIALPTLVTVLIPESLRDRANGLVGTTSGVSFLVTSVLSGVLVAVDGMRSVLVLAIVVMILGLVHLASVTVPGDRASTGDDGSDRKVDLRGTLLVVRRVPGLLALIAFSCFNNFLGGAFMALMDAYGLSMVSVQAWGLLWGALSTGIIIGGIAVARLGLGSNPVRVLLLVNIVLWTVTVLFPLRSSIVMLTAGMAVYMLLVPVAEAAEQTVLQRVVPFERQGRVFGFAQSIEQAASPITAFLIGPLAQFVVIPFMTDGWGAEHLGPWFGTGADRGLALVFVAVGVIGLFVTTLALLSRPYRRLRDAYAASRADPVPAVSTEQAG